MARKKVVAGLVFVVLLAGVIAIVAYSVLLEQRGFSLTVCQADTRRDATIRAAERALAGAEKQVLAWLRERGFTRSSTRPPNVGLKMKWPGSRKHHMRGASQGVAFWVDVEVYPPRKQPQQGEFKGGGFRIFARYSARRTRSGAAADEAVVDAFAKRMQRWWKRNRDPLFTCSDCRHIKRPGS